MHSTSPERALRGLVVTVSALALAFFAAPSAMAATNAHPNENGKAASTTHGASASSHSHATKKTASAGQNKASSHQTSGTSGTSGDTSQPQPLSGADQNTG